ncbi:MAG: stage II sporulation protein M [bacterium]|nr:stage II sporulation protein M [bacterium]
MKRSFIFTIIALLAVSTVLGAVYQVRCTPSEDIQAYISSFVSSIANGVNHKNIFLNSLRDGLLTCAVIFVCGFVRFGFLISLFTAARRCFVAGFTSAAFICSFKAKGILAAAAIELPFMLSLVPLAALCCASFMLSVDKEKRGFDSVRPYVLLTIGAMSVFAGAALCEGYAVTSLVEFILK